MLFNYELRITNWGGGEISEVSVMAIILDESLCRISVSPPKHWGRSCKGRRKGATSRLYALKNSQKSTIPAHGYPAGYIEVAASQTTHQLTDSPIQNWASRLTNSQLGYGSPQSRRDHGECAKESFSRE